MTISIIAAMDNNNGIGKNNTLPWLIPEDLRYFKEKTKGKIVVMGRKTFESIGKPLPNRHNVILTQQIDYIHPSTYSLFDIEDILEINKGISNNEIFIIGGAEIYRQFMDYAEKLYITKIDYEFECDTFFPEINLDRWDLEKNPIVSSDGQYVFEYRTYNLKIGRNL